MYFFVETCFWFFFFFCVTRIIIRNVYSYYTFIEMRVCCRQESLPKISQRIRDCVYISKVFDVLLAARRFGKTMPLSNFQNENRFEEIFLIV